MNGAQSDIDVPCKPLFIVAIRSSSVGRLPDSVERNLNMPEAKFRGLGFNSAEATPSPFPLIP